VSTDRRQSRGNGDGVGKWGRIGYGSAKKLIELSKKYGVQYLYITIQFYWINRLFK
jgi:hypothetical protein